MSNKFVATDMLFCRFVLIIRLNFVDFLFLSLDLRQYRLEAVVRCHICAPSTGCHKLVVPSIPIFSSRIKPCETPPRKERGIEMSYENKRARLILSFSAVTPFSLSFSLFTNSADFPLFT